MTLWPGLNLRASSSVSSPPSPAAITYPNSRVQRIPTKSSPPRVRGLWMNSQTRNPATRSAIAGALCLSVLSMFSRASHTAQCDFSTTATPPASVLWRISGQVTLITTLSPGMASMEPGQGRVPAGMNTDCGTARPASAKRAYASCSYRTSRPCKAADSISFPASSMTPIVSPRVMIGAAAIQGRPGWPARRLRVLRAAE